MMRYEKGRMNRPRGFDLYDGRMIGSHGGDFYWKGDYKALEKQCDEGLAREAVLAGKVDTMRRYNNEANAQNDALRERLAEAEELFKETESWMDTQSYVKPGSIWGDLHERVKKFIARPGCADEGE